MMPSWWWKVGVLFAARTAAAALEDLLVEGNFLRTSSSSSELPRVFSADPRVLVENRRFLSELKVPLSALVKSANAALKRGPYSVMEKEAVPPSGDKHDYQSIAHYWWPNPNTTDGTPYVWLDGRVNPERSKLGDVDRFKKMMSGAITCARAYFFTGDERYAAHAALLLKTWYVNEDTRMNPNLDFSQTIPGKDHGRGVGIIDSAIQIYLVDAVGLLAGSSAWTSEDDEAMRKWFAQMLAWLLTSKQGHAEDNETNNHALEYDTQVIAYALFVDNSDVAENVVRATEHRRIQRQIEPDGTQPPEMWRSISWDYVCYALSYFSKTVILARSVDVDLFHFETDDGRSIPKAIDYLIPYALGYKQWQLEQIRKFDPSKLMLTLLRVAPYDETGKYATAAGYFIQPDAVEHLLYVPRHVAKHFNSSNDALNALLAQAQAQAEEPQIATWGKKTS